MLRILIFAAAILLICLIILPRTSEEKTFERLILKTLIASCTALIIIFSIGLYHFKDTLWFAKDDLNLLLKKVTTLENSKSISLNSYDLRNVSISMLEQLPDIDHIKLKDLDLDATNKVAPLLQKNSSLLLDKFSDKPAAKIFAYLHTNTKVKCLIINDSNLKITSIKTLAESLKNNNISRLELDYNRLNDKDISEFFKAFTNNKVEELSLRGNKINDKGIISILKQSPPLKKLDLWGNQIKHHGAITLANFLKTNPPLQELNLGYNQINDLGIISIANALPTNTNLQILDLTRNPFTNPASQALLKSLQTNNTCSIKTHKEGIDANLYNALNQPAYTPK